VRGQCEGHYPLETQRAGGVSVPGQQEIRIMGPIRKNLLGSLAVIAAATLTSVPAVAQQKL